MANKKIEKIGDIKKFSFTEMTSNSNNGKTSATSVAGLYVVAIGGIGFLLGIFDKIFTNSSIEIIDQSVIMTSIGAALLGIKNIARRPRSESQDSSQLNS